MKRLLAVLLITLGVSISSSAQEHTKAPTSPTPSSKTQTTRQSSHRTTRPKSRRPARRNARRKALPVPSNAGALAWSTFTSETGRFSVLMPGQPTDRIETVQTEHGPYTSHLTVLRDPRNVFIVGWVDYDPSFNFNRHAEMEMNRDVFVERMKAKLVDSREVRIDGYQAIEFTAETADKIFRSRVYMVGRRPYQIVIGSPKGEDDSVNVDRFLNSFKVNLN